MTKMTRDMSPTAENRFTNLNALRPARRRGALAPETALRGTIPEIPGGSERLAELLGAMPARNRFGEHLALR